jgi:hypothetical protein
VFPSLHVDYKNSRKSRCQRHDDGRYDDGQVGTQVAERRRIRIQMPPAAIAEIHAEFEAVVRPCVAELVPDAPSVVRVADIGVGPTKGRIALQVDFADPNGRQ